MKLGKLFCAFLFLLGAAGISPAAERDILLVDRFTRGADAQGIPLGWELEKTPGSESKIEVEGKDGNHFLHLLSVGDSFGLKKEMAHFGIQKYPHISWKWKAVRLPKGGDIRQRQTDDQAGQLYVVFPRFPTKVNSLSLGYIWDTQAPVGHMGISTAYSKLRYVVLESGTERLNQWVRETRNVFEDFKKLFHGEEPPKVGGILIYINSQHTKSSAEIYYADIFFSEKPPMESKGPKESTPRKETPESKKRAEKRKAK